MRSRFLSLSLVLLFGFSLPLLVAEEKTLPDFSEELPEMQLVKQSKSGSTVIFFYSTMLNNKDSARTIEEFLGAGWRTRTLKQEEMVLAAQRGRAINGTVNLSVYVNPACPEYEVRNMHLNPKGPPGTPDEELNKVIEISVIQIETQESSGP